MTTGTMVIYNGVTLHNVATRQCEEDYILDPSGTDVIGQRVILTFDTTCHAQHLADMIHGVQPDYATQTTAIDVFSKTKLLLSCPRAVLQVYCNNQLLWDVRPATAQNIASMAGYDTNNGPIPKRVVVKQIVAAQVIFISFTIEFTTGLCCDGSQPHPVISNKWSVAEERDSNFFTTRRISGQVRLANSQAAGHFYVPWTIPGLEYGFKRESISFDSSANGLDASYQIIDRQVHTAAPYPATDIAGTYSWSTTLESGNWVHHSEFTLKGAPNSDVKLLVARAVELCDARIKYLENAAPLQGAIPKLMNECSITEVVGHENAVRAAMTVTMYPASPTMMIANIVDDQIGAKIELKTVGQGNNAIAYDPGKSPVSATYGYVPRREGVRSPVTLFLLHCYQQTPCSPIKGMYQWSLPSDRPENEGDAPRYPDDLTPVEPGSIDPGDMSKFDDEEELAGIYTLCRMSSTYRTTNRRAQMPIADNWTADDGQTSCAIVATGRPLSRRIVRYEAERQDKIPTMPAIADDMTINGIRHTLLNYEIETCAPKTTADGRRWIYRVEARYEFALHRAITTADELALGMLPIANEQQSMTMADDSDVTLYGE